MEVSCPKCKKKYTLRDDKIPADGAKVKCAKCKNVFKVEPPAPEQEDELSLEDLIDEEEAPEEDLPDEDLEEEEEEELEEEEEEEEEEEDFEEEEEEEEEEEDEDEEDYEEEEEEEDFEEEEDYEEDEEDFDQDMDLGGGKAKKKGGRKGLLILIILILVLGGGGAAVWYFKLYSYIPFIGGGDANETVAAEPGQEPPPAPDKPAESPAQQVKNIVLKNVRQYYLTNEKAGQLFVVEGKAVNNFMQPKELIKVEVTLYDEKGNVLDGKAQVCGNTLSMYQLQVQTKEEIDQGLNSEVGILSNNTFLRPGMDTPFMVVFFAPPETVREYQVKVVEARDPPKEK